MKFQARITVYGMKSSKGTMDTGQAYDSTKLYTLVDMDDRKGRAKGKATAEYNIGDAAEFDKFKHLPFPFEADAEFEIVTTGSQQRTIVSSIKPVSVTPSKG